MKIAVFDSTLRDGAQAEGISFSLEDKLKIVHALDNMGVDYIEAGNPGSNPKDAAFFAYYQDNPLQKPKHAKLTAFGSTRRKAVPVEEDRNVQSLLDAETDVVCIFGKSSLFHVKEILKSEPDENLSMIRETVAYLKSQGKEVIFDAEHFFDGYKLDAEYALKSLEAAEEAGAECLVLCDTNGGTFPGEILDIVTLVRNTFNTPIGIHCHNDCGMAVANSILAVQAGASHIQGTFTGFGERCGNANLSTLIPNLQIKLNHECVPGDMLSKLMLTTRLISEIANIAADERAPYVGQSAFTHKGGMHIDAVAKEPRSFEHVDPALVGNERKILMSEVAGRSTVLAAIQKVSPSVKRDSPETEKIIERLKELEHMGYQFEAAESSFELHIRKQLGKYKPLFELGHFKVIGERPYTEGRSAMAVVNVAVDGKTEVTAAEGDGPINALDKALRKALEVFYPNLRELYLIDYKVRVLEGIATTASKVRVLIESSDGASQWTTVGVSRDIIEASWIALVDSIEYKLIKDIEHKFKDYM